MWDWLLDHWWVAVLLPYVAFNIYTVKWYREDNDHMGFDIAPQVLMLFAGTWVVLLIFASNSIYRAYALWAHLRHPTNAAIWKGLSIGALAVLFWLLGTFFYIADLALMDYAPGTFERLGSQFVIITTSVWLATFCYKGLKE